MKAAVWHGKKDVRVEEVPRPPKPGPGEVQIRVKWCGICGTDLHEYQAGPIMLMVDKPHPLTGSTTPVVLGHEFSGEIVEVGREVKGFEAGDRVTVNPTLYCGECYSCKRNRPSTCEKVGFIGLHTDGAFAEYCNAPAYRLYKIPVEMSYEVGSLVEPLSVALHGLRRSNLMVGDSCVIMGAGPIGLCLLQGARAAGASLVAIVEMTESRKRKAKELGATVVLDPREVDVQAEIMKLTGGVGADVGMEAIGNPICANLVVDCIRRGGKAVMVGIYEKNTEFNFNQLVFNEKEVIGSLCYDDEFEASIALLSDGRIKGEPMITAKIGLDDLVAKGFEELIKNKENHVKIIVSPDI